MQTTGMPRGSGTFREPNLLSGTRRSRQAIGVYRNRIANTDLCPVGRSSYLGCSSSGLTLFSRGGASPRSGLFLLAMNHTTAVSTQTPASQIHETVIGAIASLSQSASQPVSEEV